MAKPKKKGPEVTSEALELQRSEAAVLRDLSQEALTEQLRSLKTEQFNLRFQAATGQLEKTHRVLEVRRNIARIKTVIREQSLKVEKG